MNEKIYLEEIMRLQDTFNRTLTGSALKTWKLELEKAEIGDNDLSLGITKMIYRSKQFNIPFIFGELLKDCQEAQIDRRERESARQKLEENKYRNLSNDEILDKGKNKVIAKAFIDLLREYLHGRLGRKEWLEKQKALSISIFGKYESILDKELAKQAGILRGEE